jgi:hypothetical protein
LKPDDNRRFNVGDHTHDLAPRLRTTRLDSLTDRVLTGPVLARGPLINQHHRWRILRVATIEEASSHEANLHRAEIIGEHSIVER